MQKNDMDRVYGTVPEDEIPWVSEFPPEPLSQLVDSGRVEPCRCIDLGCGAGGYAVFLAGRGFEVTGVDFSPAAIDMARKNALEAGVECNFVVADLLGDLREIEGRFDFAYDWSVMHHVFPEYREKYARNVFHLLNPGGKYLSVSFSEKDRFAGSGKSRTTRLGTKLYFSSRDELEELFSGLFEIIELKTIEVRGKRGPHVANYVLMEKA